MNFDYSDKLIIEVALLRYQLYLTDFLRENENLLSSLGCMFFNNQLNKVSYVLNKLNESED